MLYFSFLLIINALRGFGAFLEGGSMRCWRNGATWDALILVS